MTNPTPWALAHMTLYPTAGPTPPHTAVHLDPDTQQAVYIGPGGKPLEAGKHGSNKQTNKSLPTGGGDGKNPTPPDDTPSTDYDTD